VNTTTDLKRLRPDLFKCCDYTILDSPYLLNRWELYWREDFCDSFESFEAALKYIRWTWRQFTKGERPMDRNLRPPLQEVLKMMPVKPKKKETKKRTR
jgi:hypothetical protein